MNNNADIIMAVCIIIFLALMAFLYFVICILCEYYEWFSPTNDKDFIELSFDTFAYTYSHAPSRFSIKRYRIEYESKKYKKYKIAFNSVFDYLKYIDWLSEHKRLENRMRMEELIKDATNKGE